MKKFTTERMNSHKSLFVIMLILIIVGKFKDSTDTLQWENSAENFTA